MTLNIDTLQHAIGPQPYPLLFTAVSGAHLYGFPSPDSDYDVRGVHILPIDMIARLDVDDETLRVMTTVDGIELDLETHDVKKFFALLLKKNGNVMEQIFSPLVVETSPFHEELRAIAKTCLTRYHAYHYLGLAKKQWSLFHDGATHRVKPLLYVFRTLLSGAYLMQAGDIQPNLLTLNEAFNLPYLPDLIEFKMTAGEKAILNDVDLSFYETEYERLRQNLLNLMEISHLPEIVAGKAAVNDLLVRIRLSQLEVA